MNIVILHSARFEVLAYDRALDHDEHNIYYVGDKIKLAQIPLGLRCTRIERPGVLPLYEEAATAIAATGVTFDVLINASEYDMMDAARLRERFGIPGPSLTQAEKVRNKLVMKRCVAERGIRVPRFTTLQDWVKGATLAIEQESAVVLKPTDGASAVNVRRFPNETCLRSALTLRNTGIHALDAMSAPEFERFEVEEYVDGPVVHIDGIVKNGELRIFIASRYVNTLLDFANGLPAGSVQLVSNEAVQGWVSAVLDAVEIRLGAFHLEAIETPQGLVFLEIAHRVGGARITESFERKTGIHLSIADLRTVIDSNYEIEPVWDHSSYFGWFIVPAHHLIKPYCRVSGYEYLVGADNLLVLNKLDSSLPVPRKVTYAESLLPLAGLVRSGTPEQLIEMLQELFRRLKVEGLDAPVGNTDLRATPAIDRTFGQEGIS